MGLNSLSFPHIWRGTFWHGARWQSDAGSRAVTRFWMFLKAQGDNHLNWNILMMPSYFQAEAAVEKEWEREVVPRSGVTANPALMPPGRRVLSLTVLQWAELSFRPAGNEVSGYFSSGRSPPYRHCSGDYVASASGRSSATSSKSFNFTPCSAASNPPIPQGPSVNPCKIHTHPPHPNLPWYVSFFLTSIAPLFPILPALAVSVWVFCWVKNALALFLSLTFSPYVFHTLSFCVSFQLFSASVSDELKLLSLPLNRSQIISMWPECLAPTVKPLYWWI